MIGSDEASRLLGVSKPTLYAYVSRGLIERHTAVDGRTSLYPRDRIEQLAGRRRSTAPVERPSIDVRIGSSITQLDDATLRFRGHDVAELAPTCTFERMAELIWTGALPEREPTWPIDRDSLARCTEVVRAAGATGIDVVALCAVTSAVHDDHEATGADAARALLAMLPTVLGGPLGGSMAARLTKAYIRRPAPELVKAVDTALGLLADHELATSTLAVRVACSVRARPAAALGAGVSALGGPLHGGASVETTELIARAVADGPRAAVGSYLDGGRPLPGFGHSVYRRGDPRVAPLLDAVGAIPDAGPTMTAVDGVIAETGRRVAHLPNVDVALGALLRAGGFPPDAPIFAVARIAGWGAHYDEEAAERPLRFRGLTQLRSP